MKPVRSQEAFQAEHEKELRQAIEATRRRYLDLNEAYDSLLNTAHGLEHGSPDMVWRKFGRWSAMRSAAFSCWLLMCGGYEFSAIMLYGLVLRGV